MRTLTGIKMLPLLHDVLQAFTGSVVKSTNNYRDKTNQEFARMPIDKKRKSKKYRYYCFINDVLAVFGLKERGINVEGFTVSLTLVVIVISIVVSVLTSNLSYAILLPLILLPLSIASIFLLSRVKVRKRKQDLLDAMDMICAVMTDGFLKAVKTNMSQFPDLVRPVFKKFVNNVELLNIALPQAISMLNDEVGSLYDEFCDSVITYELNRATGMEMLFNFYISENSQTLSRDRKIKKMSDEANTDYFASIGAIVVFGIFASGSLAGDSSSGNIWITPFGRIVLLLLVVGAAAVFIFIQYLLSKPYIYTEKDK